MSEQAKHLGWSLLQSVREVGIERGIDLVLNVLFVRWMTLHADDKAKASREWASLTGASTDAELQAEFTRLAIFRESELLSATESQAFVRGLRTVIHEVDVQVGDTASGLLQREVISDIFDATLDNLERLGKQSGEADTPRALADLMAALTVRPGDVVLDPVCGNATGLVAAARFAADVRVNGFDINARVARRASMRLMVSEIATKPGSGAWCGDAFTEYAPRDADVVLAQPPWGVTFTSQQRDRIRQIANQFATAASTGFPKGDMPWLLLALDALRKPGGRAAVVLSGSSVTARCSDTHRELLALNAVEAIISFPSGVFRHTSISTVLWLLRAPAPQSDFDTVLMINASTLVQAQDKGRVLLTLDTMRIVESHVSAFRSGEVVDAPPHIARAVTRDEIDAGVGLHPATYLKGAPTESAVHPAPERALLTNIGLTNFKAFGRNTVIPLAPLTLLYGANSAGKSSIIQSLLLLKQSMQDSHLRTQGALLNVGGFEGVVHRHEGKNLEISLAYGVLPAWLSSEGTPDPTLPRTATWDFASDSSGQGAVRSTTLRFGAYELPLLRDLDDPHRLRLALGDAAAVFEGIATGTLLYPFDARHQTDGDDAEQARRLRGRINNARRAIRILESNGLDSITIQASGILATAVASDLRIESDGDRDGGIANSYVNRTARLAGGMSAELSSLLESVVWLGPLRSAPQRVYDRADTASSPGDGKHVAIYLFDHASVVEQLNDWLGRMEIPYTLDVIPVTAANASSLVGDLVAISLSDHRSGVSVTPADVGFGVSQVLPIVVELLARRESIIAVEQPETHLHPRLQARLADLFIDTVQRGGRANQLIIETHSEHLMLRVQRRIREGALDASEVSVVYVDQDDSGQATATPLRINERGEFLDQWPDGFFDDRLEELFGAF